MKPQHPTNAPNGVPFVTLDNVTLRAGGELLFEHTNWQMKSDQHWVIIGPTGSGKSTLANAIFRQVPIVHGRVLYFFERNNGNINRARSFFNRGEIVRISSESHRNVMQQQAGYHQARWQSIEGRNSPTVSDLLTGESIERISPYDVSPLKVSKEVYKTRRQKAVDVLGIEYLLGRKLLHLSHGETRKVLIAQALMQSPQLLILDDPFCGLDYSSRAALQSAIDDLLTAESLRVLLVTSRPEDIPQGITHALRVASNRVVDQGPKDNVLQIETAQDPVRIKSFPSFQFPITPQELGGKHPILVDMKDTSVSYGETHVLHGINWTMRQGENWAVLGSNGAGKTTLLSLILADNPQSYANEITLFGKRRGSGESVWDIKRRIGWVSPELQAYHQKGTTCHSVVCSGFFDSVGLYQTCSAQQARVAQHWLSSFGISDLADRPLGTVSTGEQRLVFLARALVKNPALLILDEPCQGLDFSNRTRIIDLLDQLCLQMPVSLIFVTHRFDEMPKAITHVLKLEQGRIQESGTRRNILGW